MLKWVAFVVASAAAFSDGCYAVPARVEALVKLEVRPVVFFLYNAFSVFIFCWLCVALLDYNTLFIEGGSTTFEFVWLGFLSGALMGLTIFLSFIVVDFIGISLGTAIHSGVTVFVSAMFSLTFLSQDPSNILAYCFGVALIILGIVGLVYFEEISKICQENVNKISYDALPLSDDFGGLTLTNLEVFSADSERYTTAIIFAICCGVVGGLSMLPYEYVDTSDQGLVFMPAFGTGIMTVALLCVGGSSLYNAEGLDLHLNSPIVIQMGMLSGLFLSFSFVLTFFALAVLSYGVVIPIVMCSVLVAAFWGVVIFDEVKGPVSIATFIFFAVIIISGTVLLSVGDGDL